jgi:hypothetical protein
MKPNAIPAHVIGDQDEHIRRSKAGDISASQRQSNDYKGPDHG